MDNRCCRENSQCATAWQLWAKQCPARVTLDPGSVTSTASPRTPKQWHTRLSNAPAPGKTTLKLQALGLRRAARSERVVKLPGIFSPARRLNILARRKSFIEGTWGDETSVFDVWRSGRSSKSPRSFPGVRRGFDPSRDVKSGCFLTCCDYLSGSDRPQVSKARKPTNATYRGRVAAVRLLKANRPPNDREHEGRPTGNG